jgi:hypothetical protein
MKETDIKILWGRAAGRCTICGCRLTQDQARATEAFPLGEHAHIVGDKPGSARYEDALDAEKRDGYSNRILLCPTDHVVIDKNPDDWPVARLYMEKAEHELRVESTLSSEQDARTQADTRIYSGVVDSLTEKLQLDRFSRWASGLLEPYWRWPTDVYDGVEAVRFKIFATDWPGTLPALEVALDRASFELQEAAAHFTQYSALEDDWYHAQRWYKRTMHPQDVYERLDSDFWLWSDTLEQRIVEATKALNWAREVWRTSVNPMWLASNGWFTLQLHPDQTLRTGFLKPQYTSDEKARLLTAGIDQADIRAPSVARRD